MESYSIIFDTPSSLLPTKMINSTQITVPYRFLLLMLLVVCVDFGCRAQQRPFITSSLDFQTANSDLILSCNPGSFNPSYDPLTYKYNGIEVYNSKTKVENGVKPIIIQSPANSPINSVRVLDRKSYLSSVTCAYNFYNNSVSSNSLNIPYLNIDQYSHSQKFELDQTVTISCILAMAPIPSLFVIHYLFNGTIYFMYIGTNKHEDPYFRKVAFPDAEVTPVLESRFPKYSIKVKPFRNIDNFRHGKGRCELSYDNNEHKNLKVQSDELDLSKNHSATLSQTISAFTLVCICVVSYLLNPLVMR